ncbi:MAG: hypothetical protein JW798_01905 [Prolixibacteraceae bacterium]|nr:hypothetical protein [Prolixibacteraceae bacterium]
MIANIDSIFNHTVKGWCFNPKTPLIPLSVTLYIDGKEFASQKADKYRSDLEKKIHPNGCCAFNFKLPDTIKYNGQHIEVEAGNEKIKSRFVALLGESGKEKIHRIQIYGERASGTNYLKQLLIRNIPNIIHTNQYGWKHFFPPKTFPDSDRCLFLVIFRDPFDWIRSLYLQPHHVHPSLKNIPFSEFIRFEWQCVWEELADVYPGDEKYGKEMMFERNPKNGRRFENVIRLRNAKIRAFESLKARVKHVEYVRYEDLAKEPEKFINRLAQKYDLHTVKQFQNITTYKGITPKAYKPKTYKDFSEEDLRFILLHMDVAIEKRIGYSSSFSGKIMSPMKLWLEKKKYFLKYKLLKAFNNQIIFK